MTDLQVALLRELVEADTERSGELAELETLAAEVAVIRERSEALIAILEGAATERARLEAERGEAGGELEERTAAERETAAALSAAEAEADAERAAAARRAHVRAGDALHVAERRAAAAAESLAAFEELVAAAGREAPEVEREAAVIAESLRGRPRVAGEACRVPRAGLDGVVEWTATARAALFVARTAAATEREAVIRQANELGSAILGEPLVASSTAVVANRVDAALRPRA